MSSVIIWSNWSTKGKHVAINTDNTTAMGYYDLKYVSGTFTLHEDIKTNRQVSTPGELAVQYE